LEANRFGFARHQRNALKPLQLHDWPFDLPAAIFVAAIEANHSNILISSLVSRHLKEIFLVTILKDIDICGYWPNSKSAADNTADRR
jgi:hypothetical protein